MGLGEYAGFSKSQCSCPHNTNVGSYTDAMFANCLKHGLAYNHRVISCIYEIQTPKVVQKVREYFNCNTLTGMPLENDVGRACEMPLESAHWEERWARNELMGASVDSDEMTYTSPMTLALFEDSGWYTVNYSMASTPIKNVHWGYQQGCSFVTEKCVKPDTSASATYPYKTDFPGQFCHNNSVVD